MKILDKKGFTLRLSSGFTLIEMLIVIAIIGILSAAVLAGLGPARNKAKEARVISGMNQVRSIAEAYYNPSSNAPYAGLASNVDIKRVKDDIESASASASTLEIMEINSGANYKATAKLLVASDSYYCVDSIGNAKTVAGSVATGPDDCEGKAFPGSGNP